MFTRLWLLYQAQNGSILLLDSKNVRHGTVANSGFFQIGVALLTKKSTLDSFERTTKEMDEIRRTKEKKNKQLYDQILENLKIKKIKPRLNFLLHSL